MSDEHMHEGMSVQPKLYELGYLLAPLIASGSVGEEVARIKGILGDGVKAEGAPQIQRLAYTISKNIGSNRHDFDDAYIGWIKFEATPEHMSTIKRELDKLEMIVRYLLIKAELADTDLSPEAMIAEVPEAGSADHTEETPEEDASEVKKEEKAAPEDRDAAIDKEIDELLERGL